MVTRRLAALAALTMVTACERVVDVELQEGPRRLVIEARLERVKGRVSGDQAITLTTTAPYFDANPSPPARGAVVRVVDESGRTYPFTEARPGVYTTSALTIDLGRRYTLRIDFEGQSYEAVETAIPVAAIDSLYFDKPQPGRFSGEGGVRATIDLRDPPGEKNFYLWDQFVNGVRQLGPDSTFLFRVTAPDDGFDGTTVTGFQPFEGVDIPMGAVVLLRQIGLSEQGQRYYFALSDQVSAGGSPFAVPPASVRSNVANRTDPRRFPVGYFQVSEVSEARATRR